MGAVGVQNQSFSECPETYFGLEFLKSHELLKIVSILQLRNQSDTRTNVNVPQSGGT